MIRLALGGALALSVAACTSIRHVPPAEISSKQLPEVVSVTYPDNTVLVVMAPALSADTLRGLRWGTQDSVAIPLDSVRTVQAKVSDPGKTMLLAGAVGLVVATGVYVIVSSTGMEDESLRACSGDAAQEHPEEFPQCGP